MAMGAYLHTNSEQNYASRPLANFPPTLWGYSFASVPFSEKEFETYTERVEALKEKVKDMLMASTRDAVENIEFINLLCRLGISYYFENEIEEQLQHIFQALPNLLKNNDYDLYITSLLFQILRQYGYKMSYNVFNKFKGSDDKFKNTLIDDVKGILGLYEAAHLSLHGEDTLDEAISFTRAKLEDLAVKSNPHLEKHIKDALVRPFHKGVPRIEVRQFISFYEEDESRNETLLMFAKLDFNRVQLLHRQELNNLSRWWKDLNCVKEFPYARDRIVEIYFWACGIHFEPQYALSRMMITKYTMLVSVVDDTYDSYATFEEVKYFTNAMDRCNVSIIDQLPTNNMKVLYKAILDLFDETERVVAKKGRSYCVHYVKEAFKELVRGYHTEKDWSSHNYVPKFNEYISNGLATSAYGVIMAASYIGLDKLAGIKEYEWLKSNPKIIKAGKMIGRLMNDIVGHEEEQKRGDCATGVECYMKEYGVSKKEAIEEIKKIDAKAWKDINEDCMRPTAVSFLLLNQFVNLIRVTDVIYDFDDAYTNPLTLKDYVTSLWVEQVPF